MSVRGREEVILGEQREEEQKYRTRHDAGDS